MKKVLYIVTMLIALLIINVKAAGNVTTTVTEITMNKGQTKTFTINAENVAGKVDIVSSNNGIATVNQGSYFFDTSLNNSSTTITVSGVEAGETTIRVILTDIATFEEEEITGERVINVTVVDPNGNNEDPGNNTDPGNNEEPGNNEDPGNNDNPGNTEEPGNNNGEVVNNVPKTAMNTSTIILIISVVAGIFGLGVILLLKNKE